jgi:1-aminocyclopropane-1-carboxylate deaminase
VRQDLLHGRQVNIRQLEHRAPGWLCHLWIAANSHPAGFQPNRGQGRRGTVEGVTSSSVHADAPGHGSISGGIAGPLPLRIPSLMQELHDERLARAGVRLLLKRDDLINPDVPGNKWRKLKYNLAEAERSGHHTLLTFGGAYSNHIRATAAAGECLAFSTIGVIRGEEHLPLNDSLACAVRHGMRLTYLDRATYRHKDDPAAITRLRRTFGAFYLVPEGGSNALGVRGCAEIPAEINDDFEVICCACGTGGTLAGIALGLSPGQRAIGFPVLKNGGFLADEVSRLQREAAGREVGRWDIELGYHFGGYAKIKPDLAAFIADFNRHHGLLLNRIYVAKMMYGIIDLSSKGFFTNGSTVIAVITG